MFDRRTEFAYVVISTLFLVLMILSWGFKEATLHLFGGAPITLQVGDGRFPLYIGKLPFQVVLLAFALLFLTLLNEFFGARSAFYLLLAAAMALFILWFFLLLIPWLPDGENSGNIHEGLVKAVDLNKQSLLALVASTIVGFGLLSFFFELFRKITHNSFSIVRLFMAHAIGLGFFLSLFVFLNSFPGLNFGGMLALFVARFIQWFLLFLFLIPFYYSARWCFGALVTEEHEYKLTERFAKKSLFTHREKDFFEAHQETQEKRIG